MGAMAHVWGSSGTHGRWWGLQGRMCARECVCVQRLSRGVCACIQLGAMRVCTHGMARRELGCMGCAALCAHGMMCIWRSVHERKCVHQWARGGCTARMQDGAYGVCGRGDGSSLMALVWEQHPAAS